MMEGGIQVNTGGRRFSNEYDGYSEQSVAVPAQPGAVAWCLWGLRAGCCGLSFRQRPSDRCRFRRAGRR